MNQQVITSEYQAKITQLTQDLQAAKQKVSLLAWSRFILFIGFCFCWWPVIKYTQYWFILPAFISMAVFAVLVRVQVKKENEALFLQELTNLVKAELQAMAGNFSGFDTGGKYIHFDHAYSFDLDVFGEGSLYQQLNRTRSEMGSETLAHWLQQPLKSKKEILERQQAFHELSQKHTFREHFQTWGALYPFTQKEQHELSAWMNEPNEKPSFNTLAKILLVVLPIATIGLWICWMANLVHYSIPSFFSAINITWVYNQMKQINELHQQLGNKFKLVKNLSRQLNMLEQERFKSEMMNELQQQLKQQDANAGKAIYQLGIIMQNFDTRLNMLGAFVFNALFLFDLQMCLRLNNWKKQFGVSASKWIEVIGTVEAVNSLGTYVYHHPEFIFPEVTEAPVVIQASEMGHPLMPMHKRVNNTFSLSGKGKFVIVTGSNMSGKSTFLRTTGLNMVLAQMGAPVCANAFSFSPVDVFTSMRINDSLQQNESYFYAEIKRLNKITREAALQKPILILLDEILRGTNSTDKHTGSQALMLKLTELNATGILATHDLSLGELAQQHPQRFENKCFESVITNNELHFDYKIREGVCQNLNAVFLMKKMGIM